MRYLPGVLHTLTEARIVSVVFIDRPGGEVA
jgi:hypothetical protein